jgi:hypothetical protein
MSVQQEQLQLVQQPKVIQAGCYIGEYQKHYLDHIDINANLMFQWLVQLALKD